RSGPHGSPSRRSELADDLDALAQARAALVDRHAAALVFLRKLPADADAENEPPGRQVIEGGNLLGNRCGMTQRQQEHGGAEGQAPADRGGLGDLRDGIEERYGERDMVATPEGIEAQPIYLLDHLHQLIEC